MNKKANHSAVILSVIALFALGGIAIINSGATGAVSTALPCTTAADCPNGQACIEGFCQVFERAGPISEGVEFTAVPLGNPSQATIRIQRIQNLRASADSYFMPRATVQMIITTSGQTILGHSNGPLELIDPLKNSENWEFNFKLIDDTIVSLSIPNPALFGELNANENGFRVQTDSAHYSMLTDAAAQIRSLCVACEVTTNPAALDLNVRYSVPATEFGFSVPQVSPPDVTIIASGLIPLSVVINAGSTVDFFNSDVDQAALSCTGGPEQFTTLINPGNTFTQVFNIAGFSYLCEDTNVPFGSRTTIQVV